MFQLDFMRHAFMAGTIIALMCGIIGVFVMARNLSFISHTFSHVGFAGAAFAVFIGWDPILGLMLFTILISLAIGSMGVNLYRREASVSVMLSVFLGLGILFLSLSSKSSAYATNILFGSVVGISAQQVKSILCLASMVIIIIIIFYRYLKFDSFDPVGAKAAGLPVTIISIGFLILLSISVSITVQIIGALLVFSLVTMPASSARLFVHTLPKMIVLSIVFAMIGVWLGLILSYYTLLPVTFYITAIEASFYFLGLIYSKYRR